MNGSILEVVVIGAGHAGLSASYYLRQLGMEHIVFERGRVGETWRSQRWDSFAMNTANRINALPGSTYLGKHPEAFCSANEFVTSLESYVSKFQLPVRENTTVLSVEKPVSSPFFIVTVKHENEPPQKFNSWQVIIASGTLNEKKLPTFASLISPEIKQIHTSEYRNPARLPDGAVLVIGGAQSGCQVAEDLLEAGRKVYLSTSQVPRIPRRYRGKDFMDWFIECKFMEERTSAVTDPKILSVKMPLLSGIGEGGHTISLQYLAQKGVILLGKMEKAEGIHVTFQRNTVDHMKYADDYSNVMKGMIDEYILNNRLQAADGELDYADLPDTFGEFINAITSMNLLEHNIHSIIWATGLDGQFNYIMLPVLNRQGRPKHQNGITDIEGLYFLAGPWLRSRKSNLIFGIKDDAAFICNKIYSSLR